ncbi:MAG: heavy-metal-associated domain-containing protein [Myxococcota bacterium]
MISRVCMLAMLGGCSWGTTPAPVPMEAPAPQLVDTQLQIDSMQKCNRCAMNVRMAIREQEGVSKVYINIAKGQMVVTHDKAQVTADDLIEASKKAQPDAVVVTEAEAGTLQEVLRAAQAKADAQTADTDTDAPGTTEAPAGAAPTETPGKTGSEAPVPPK